MINRIESSNQTNYKPSFGTTVTIKNKLNPLLQHHKDVAPILRKFEESADIVRKNGKIDDMQVKFKKSMSWLRNYITAEYKIKSGDGIETKGSVKLFRYKNKSAQAMKMDEFDKLGGEEQAIPKLYNAAPTLADTIVKQQLPPKLYTVHEDIHPYFKAIQEALNEISFKKTAGLLNVRYRITNTKEHGKEMKIISTLESASKKADGTKIAAADECPLFEFDKNMNAKTVNVSDPKHLSDRVLEIFNNLKISIDKQIQAQTK